MEVRLRETKGAEDEDGTSNEGAKVRTKSGPDSRLLESGCYEALPSEFDLTPAS